VDSGVEGEAVALGAGEFEADPMIFGGVFGAENHWTSFQIFDDEFEVAVVEEIAYGEAAADLRNLNGGTSELADVAKFAVVLIEEEEFGLAIFCSYVA